MLQKHKKASLRLFIGSRIQLPSKRCDLWYIFSHISYSLFLKKKHYKHISEHISPFTIQTNFPEFSTCTSNYQLPKRVKTSNMPMFLKTCVVGVNSKK